MTLAVLHPWGAVMSLKPLQGPPESCGGGSAAHCHCPFLHPHPQPAQASQAFICMNKSETQGDTSSLPGKFGVMQTALPLIHFLESLPGADAPYATNILPIPSLHPH